MIKKIIIAVLCVAVLGVGAYFIFRPVPLNGSVGNSHSVSLCIRDNEYYDVLIPNEATLLETDEHSIYRYDLLSVGVQDLEPEADYKVMVSGRWVYATSKDKWLAPTAHSFESNQSYTVNAVYEPVLEGIEVVWNDGPAPELPENTEVCRYSTHTHALDDYIIVDEVYGLWDDTRELLLCKLCHLTGDYVPHYYDDGRIFYARSGDYAVGMSYINYNTNIGALAKGTAGIDELITIIKEG